MRSLVHRPMTVVGLWRVVQASGGLVFFGSCLGVGLLMAVRPVHSTASDFSSSCLLLLAMCVPPSVAGPVLSTAAVASLHG